MDVMLRQEVEKLGKPGDIVSVADGYARNYLLPRNMAKRLTPGIMREAEVLRQQRQEQEQEELERLQAIGERLSGFLTTVEVRANEEGQLFGSVHERQIVDDLAANGFEDIRISNVVLESPIRELGDHEVEIRLHPEVRVHITVRVVAVSQPGEEGEEEV